MTQNDAESKQNKQSLSGIAMSGDVTGTTGSATVTALRGNAIQNAAPSIGDFLIWNNGASQWQPALPSNGPLIAGLVVTTGTYNVASTDTIVLSTNIMSGFINLPSPDTVGRIILTNYGIGIGASGGLVNGRLSSISSGMAICYDGINWSTI